MLNNIKRKLLETQHSKFENSRFGFIEYVQNRESIILFQEYENYSYLNHINNICKSFQKCNRRHLKMYPSKFSNINLPYMV